jgi:hypothetical protein
MARKQKQTPVAPVAETPVAPVAETPVAETPVAETPVAPVLPVDVKVAGMQVVAARNVLVRAANLGNVPAALANATLVAGRPCKVRVPYTQAGVLAMLDHIAKHGPSTGAALAGVANGDLLTYSVRRGWLVQAPQ